MLYLRFAALLAVALSFFAAPSVAFAEEIPGSGCDPDLYTAFCAAHIGGSGLRCGAELLPEKTPTEAVITAYTVATDEEVGYCFDLSGKGLCDMDVPDREWFVLEVELFCGNGSIFWRSLSRVSAGRLEQVPYSRIALETLGLWSHGSMLALARFRILAHMEAPTARAPAPEGDSSERAGTSSKSEQ